MAATDRIMKARVGLWDYELFEKGREKRIYARIIGKLETPLDSNIGVGIEISGFGGDVESVRYAESLAQHICNMHNTALREEPQS